MVCAAWYWIYLFLISDNKSNYGDIENGVCGIMESCTNVYGLMCGFHDKFCIEYLIFYSI